MKKLSLAAWLAVSLLLTVAAQPAQAYLDPASGSLLLQLLLGGIAGAALAIKLFWHRITGFFRGTKEHGKNDQPPA